MSYNVTLTLSRTPAGTYLPKSQLGFLLQVNILKAQPVWYNIFILPSSLRSVLQRLLSHMLFIGTRAQSSSPLSVSPNSRQRRCWLQEQRVTARISWPSIVSFC